MISISVIIPVFKRVELLEACLVSFQNSEYKPLEIIVVDDGNDEDVGVKIRDIAVKYLAHYIRCDKNGGAPAARNAGARIAQGEALFFADADIEMAPEGLGLLSEALEKNERASFAYGDFNFGSVTMQAREFSLDALRKTNYISTMALVRRAIFRPFDERLKRFQDWDLWLSLAERGATGVYVPHTIFTATPGGSMSDWIPSIVIKYAPLFMWVPRVRKFIAARKIILKKHSL
jgi:glycosyltransferase involved in cell wall biosynthesis